MLTMLFNGQPDKQGRQDSEYERLYKAYQQFDHADEHHEQYRYRCDIQRFKYEYQTKQCKHQDVSGRDICEQTNGQCNWLGKQTDDLNRDHQGV